MRPPDWPQRIISGGQTGVDRAALEVALALGIEHGGWCPRGRLSEDGSIPSRYELVECDSANYRVRTELNVLDGDATLILHRGPLRGGTLLTKRLAVSHGKPCRCFVVQPSAVEAAGQWLRSELPRVLNVAGPRESLSPGIEQQAAEFLLAVLAR